MKNSQNLPKQYLKGYCEFYKLKFKVTPQVLIPRPETELLVDEVLDFILRAKREDTLKTTILDIGTGSGNIAISIAKNLPKSRIFATDISEEALEVAKENAKLNKVENKIFFIKSDLLDVIASEAKQSSSDLDKIKIAASPAAPRNDNIVIVANLPYIPRGRVPYLDPQVKDFEPWIALDGGSDGFDLYRKLFKQISQLRMHNPGLDLNAQTGIGYLKLIVCEIDETQGELAANEAQKYFPEANIEVKTDLAKKQRILVIQP